MPEDLLIGSTQVILFVLFPCNRGDTVLGTAAMAQRPEFALLTLAGKLGRFGAAKALLLLAGREFSDISEGNITERLAG